MSVGKLVLLIGFSLLNFGCPWSALAQMDGGTVTLKDAVEKIEKRDGVKFFYRNDWIKDITLNITDVNLPLDRFLDEKLQEKGLGSLLFYDSKYIFLFKGAPPYASLQIQSPDSTLKNVPVIRSEQYSVTGIIRDAATNEPIIGATVHSTEQAEGTVTDVNGRFLIKLKYGVHRLRFTAVGKLPTTQVVNVTEDQQISIEMFEQAIELDEITVMARGLDNNVSSTETGLMKIDIKTLKSIPQFMGEVDVIRSLLLLPGVSTVGEGASGFNVRGGNVDQNLILLDETPLFNSSHLFGFFSTFNPDFVKDVKLFKGGMPANYGGRIASILDVKTKDGNSTKLSGTGGLGIISSRLLLEGPIGKKTTFMVGGRYAYPDWIIKRVPDLNVQRSSSNFYDLNLKLHHQFNDKNDIYFSGYRSADQFKFAADTTYAWSTTNFSLRWNTVLSSKVFANVTAIYSDYLNQVSGTKVNKEFQANFGIDTRGGKIDVTYIPTVRHRIDVGISRTYYTFNPGTLTTPPGSIISSVSLDQERSIESGYYISDEFSINPTVSVHAGIRYSTYDVKGENDVAIYDPTQPKSPSTVLALQHFGSGENIVTYSGWEPRLSMKFSVSQTSSIKLSYNRNLQYLQLVSNTTAVSPLDLWKSSNFNIKPQTGNQISVGYFRNFKQNVWEVSLEGYYKTVENILEYKDGANLFLNPYLEADLLPAKGEAYGAELLIRKKEGKLTGWIAYTYARSFRQVDGPTPSETINYGKPYPSNFDKPNDVAIVANYVFTRRLSLSANFTYSTGRPVTYPSSVYILDGYAVAQFNERNQARIPDYHRLDLSFTIEESLKKSKKWKGSWTLSIYNVYGRTNPYSVFFKPGQGGYQTQSYSLAIIGVVFPSITYNFKF